MFNSNQAFLLMQRLKSFPKGFTLIVEAEIEKKNSICPKLVINVEFYGLVLVPRLEKGYHQICEAHLEPLGPMFQHLLNIVMSMF
jgi:hypothetical protein